MHFLHPHLFALAQAAADERGFSPRRWMNWFLHKDPVAFQIPVITALVMAAVAVFLLIRLIRRQQNLGFSYDHAEKHGKAIANPHVPEKKDLPPLQPSRKRALSPVAPDIDTPRGPLRFGPSRESEEHSEPPHGESK